VREREREGGREREGEEDMVCRKGSAGQRRRRRAERQREREGGRHRHECTIRTGASNTREFRV
jgi:hypothetical protein